MSDGEFGDDTADLPEAPEPGEARTVRRAIPWLFIAATIAVIVLGSVVGAAIARSSGGDPRLTPATTALPTISTSSPSVATTAAVGAPTQPSEATTEAPPTHRVGRTRKSGLQ